MFLKEFSAKTHQGPYLQINEDGFEFDLENDFAVVVDGFGGSNIGSVVIRKVLDGIMKAYKEIVSDRDATMPFFYAPEYLVETNAMINACLKVHQEIYQNNLTKKPEERGGASLTIMAKSDSIVSFISIGNCRAYLYRDGELKLIGQDKTFESLTNNHHPLHLRTTPLSVLGMYQRLDYSLNEMRLEEDDKLFLTTDGIYGHVSEEDIIEVIKTKDLNPNEKLENLFDLANNRGNKDNQAAILLSY